jgi:hypothetical protein
MVELDNNGLFSFWMASIAGHRDGEGSVVTQFNQPTRDAVDGDGTEDAQDRLKVE